MNPDERPLDIRLVPTAVTVWAVTAVGIVKPGAAPVVVLVAVAATALFTRWGVPRGLRSGPAAVVAVLWLVVHLWLGVPLAGSVPLILLATTVYLFAVTALGIMLATLASSMPQFGLLSSPVYAVLYLLSGAATPVESMPPRVQQLVQFSPTTQFVRLVQSVLYRDAGLDIVWPQLLIVTAAGAFFLVIALSRFRSMLARQG